MQKIIVRVPATSANLGPGFDCLAMGLDLWNTTTFTFGGSRVRVRVRGEGQGKLPEDEGNLIYQAFRQVSSQKAATFPQGLLIECENQIPLSSGLGSSAAATLTGLIAANTWLAKPLTMAGILQIAAEMEGHADNAAAALYGGFVVVLTGNGKPTVYPLSCAIGKVVIVMPEISLSTRQSRAVIPPQIPIQDAVFNIGRTALAVEGFRTANFKMLAEALQDRLHQPYRLKLIPGAQEAVDAAYELGARVVLSGAGPSLIAFTPADFEEVESVMVKAFQTAGLKTRSWILKTTSQPAFSDIV